MSSDCVTFARLALDSEVSEMSGVRRVSRSILKWFSALYVVAIIVQVFLAGEGIFGLNNIKHSDDCDKAGPSALRTPRRSILIVRSGFS